MKKDYRAIINSSLTIASQEIANLIESISSDEIESLIEKILKTSANGNNLIITGVGTSGVAANKVVHSLRCQNLPAFYLSPGDALHGASGVVKPDDLFIAISNGGSSSTVNKSALIAKERGANIVAITSSYDNALAKIADALVMVKVEKESDYVGLLATSSIICVIALFDAVCSVIMYEKNFTQEMFLHIHPEGKVGQLISGNHVER